MGRPSVSTTYNSSIRDINILASYINSYQNLEARYQYLVSEVVMLRLFAVVEIAIADVALKLACGASYLNGTAPSVLIPCRSRDDAAFKMLNQRPKKGRPRFLRWTKENLIQDSIRYVLDTADPFFVSVQNNSLLLNEMRIIRNKVAHRDTTTKADYLAELARIYSANINLPVGAFLTSTSRHKQSNIERYILSAPILLRDLVNG